MLFSDFFLDLLFVGSQSSKKYNDIPRRWILSSQAEILQVRRSIHCRISPAFIRSSTQIHSHSLLRIQRIHQQNGKYKGSFSRRSLLLPSKIKPKYHEYYAQPNRYLSIFNQFFSFNNFLIFFWIFPSLF